MNTSLLSAAPTGYNSVNAIVRENPMDVVTTRTSAAGYVVLNSRDRYLTAQPNQRDPIIQPWNNFNLQRAQAMIPSFAKRLQVSEIRFPWYIPNITQRNDTLDWVVDSPVGPKKLAVAVVPGFYTPVTFLAAFNAALSAQYVGNGMTANNAPVLEWDIQYQSFYFRDVSGSPALPWGIAAPDAAGGTQPGVYTASVGYYNNPSLALTMGVPYAYLTTNSLAYKYLNTVPGTNVYMNSTMFLYTDYVDIVSDQMMRFTDARDGGSNDLNSNSIMCRLYVADEISVATPDPIGSSPFLIHRQFKNPKTIKWEPRSFVSYMDIKVLDQYGEPVPLLSSAILPVNDAYPDFQITLLASED